MPATPQDPFSGQSGPFSKYLDPAQTVQPVQWSNGQQPNGWEGKTGNIAFLGTKLLEGITKGRVAAFAKKEQEKMQTFGRLTSMMEAIRSNPDVSPETKASIEKQYAVMLGKVGSSQIKDSGATKDKGTRGHIAGTLASVFDKMAGGEFKGDPLTVEDMSNFMGTAAQALEGKSSTAASAYSQQQKLIDQGMSKARQIAAQDNRRTVTINDVNQVPEIQQALRWYGQYAPEQLKAVQNQFAVLPQLGTKEFAQAEYSARTLNRPPESRTQAPPPARPGAEGYLGTVYGEGQGAAPPDSRSVARLGDTSVVRNPPHSGPPPESDPDKEAMESLREMAGIGPKAERNVWVRDPVSGQSINVPESQSKVLLAQWGRQQGDQKIKDAEARNEDLKKFRWDKFAYQKQYQNKNQELASKRLNVYAQSVGVNAARLKLSELENKQKLAPHEAFTALINHAISEGVPLSNLVDNADEILKGIDDPRITAQSDYIIETAEKIKRGEKSGDTAAIISLLTGGNPADKPATPPAARQDKPPAARQDGKPRPAAKHAVSDMASGFGIDLGDSAPPASQKKTVPANGNPY